ncbi:uncharacterized protein LOC142227943 [Haematobia irritans]|uniref:uncharacterized protein LOC142227943 n=1 Tax=Haematobia irritans TaxID=7368 RepID=UPI003F504D5C
MNKVIEIIDSDEDNEAISASTSSNNIEFSESPQSQSRRRPRKSALQAKDVEVQFGGVELVDEDNGNNTNTIVGSDGQNERNTISSQRATPKILAPKTTNAEAIQKACEDFISREEVLECISSIAQERVRINHLLAAFGMPEINFSLYNSEDILKIQFEERLKQFKIMQNLNSQRGHTNANE